jgi:hypothetical protein
MLGMPLRAKTARKVNLFFRIGIGFVAASYLLIQFLPHALERGTAKAAHTAWHPAFSDTVLFVLTVYALLACLRGRWNPFSLRSIRRRR